ncbi:sigma-70 family RNA polymerase sigma factor [Singulisphaera sp. PoT]|uniref:sigma-70 family RNA polymerase sigma factor n=1 Tax=Singulisphaera sp. PoT TaxID=3411797 RepID=UPI003BF5DCB2
MESGHRGSVLDSVRVLFDSGSLSALGEGELLERFLSEKDTAAFEAIVLRHGAMVLGVCRRILHDPHDVDDAFQATFLILVEKARSIRDREILGLWLHGVARRVAVRARVNARSRHDRERRMIGEAAVEGTQARRSDDEELRLVIDDELGRLPWRYRAALVLCDLEGQSYEQAAEALRCPVGTIKSRLARGRERLRGRLTRRGLAPSTVLVVATLTSETASAIPLTLMGQTIRVAAQRAAGRAAAGCVSAEVARLTEGVIRSMTVAKWKAASAAILAVAGVVGVGSRALLSRPAPAAGQAAAESTRPRAKDAPIPLPGVEQFQLENGLRVFLRPIPAQAPGSDQTALLVGYSIGEWHDPDGQSGLAHLVEHTYVTAAAGNVKARTSWDFFGRYPRGGNAQTGGDYTLFATSFDEVDMLHEITDAAARMGDLHPEDEDLERERHRVLQEVTNMFTVVPSLASENNARELIRPAPGTGRKGGQPREIKALTREQVEAHWRRYYKPRNAILALAGPFDPKAARAAIEASFGKIPPGEPSPPPRPSGAPRFGQVRELTSTSPPPQPGPNSMASLAYPAPPPESDLYAPFLVLAMRLHFAAGKLDGHDTVQAPIFFSPLDDPGVLVISTSMRDGESGAKALARIEAVLADALKPKAYHVADNIARRRLGSLFGIPEVSNTEVARNAYGVAFSIIRRAQMGIDSAKLTRDLDMLTDEDMKRTIRECFAPGKHAAAFIR